MAEIVCVSLFGLRTQKGLVQMSCQSKDFTIQMACDEARDLAANLLGAASAAETDQAVADWLRTDMGMTNEQVGMALQRIRQMRE